MNINQILAKEFNLRQEQVDNTVSLIDDDKTIPFIARYRKEQTGSLDDTVLRELSDRLTYLRNLEKRKQEISASITEQEKMTEEISAAIEKAMTLVEVEDIYRPFKPKRKTRGSVAREKGLEPLAKILLEQKADTVPNREAEKFIDEEKGVATAEDALQGAMDIIAEDLSDSAELRKKLRELIFRKGTITSAAAAEDSNEVYKNYFEFSGSVSRLAGHQTLALDRGEKEGQLKVSVSLPEGEGESMCVREFTENSSECGKLFAQRARTAISALSSRPWNARYAPSFPRTRRRAL